MTGSIQAEPEEHLTLAESAASRRPYRLDPADERKPLALQAYARGELSCAMIRRQYGLGAGTLRKWISEAGIQRRGRGHRLLGAGLNEVSDDGQNESDQPNAEHIRAYPGSGKTHAFIGYYLGIERVQAQTLDEAISRIRGRLNGRDIEIYRIERQGPLEGPEAKPNGRSLRPYE